MKKNINNNTPQGPSPGNSFAGVSRYLIASKGDGPFPEGAFVLGPDNVSEVAREYLNTWLFDPENTGSLRMYRKMRLFHGGPRDLRQEASEYLLREAVPLVNAGSLPSRARIWCSVP